MAYRVQELDAANILNVSRIVATIDEVVDIVADWLQFEADSGGRLETLRDERLTPRGAATRRLSESQASRVLT